MHAKGPVYASRKQVENGQTTVWINRGGDGKTSGAGPLGRRATPGRLLKRAMAERDGVAKAVKERQAARVRAKNTPPKLAG